MCVSEVSEAKRNKEVKSIRDESVECIRMRERWSNHHKHKWNNKLGHKMNWWIDEFRKELKRKSRIYDTLHYNKIQCNHTHRHKYKNKNLRKHQYKPTITNIYMPCGCPVVIRPFILNSIYIKSHTYTLYPPPLSLSAAKFQTFVSVCLSTPFFLSFRIFDFNSLFRRRFRGMQIMKHLTADRRISRRKFYNLSTKLCRFDGFPSVEWFPMCEKALTFLDTSSVF